MLNKEQQRQLEELDAEEGNNVEKIKARRKAMEVLQGRYAPNMENSPIVDESPNEQELLDPNQVNRVLKKQGFKLQGQEDKGILDGLFHLINRSRR